MKTSRKMSFCSRLPPPMLWICSTPGAMRRTAASRSPAMMASSPSSSDAPTVDQWPLERHRALERFQRAAIVAARLVGVADRVIGVQIRRVLGERAPAHLEPLVVVAGLLEEEAEHGLVLGLAGIGLQAPPRDVDAAAVVAPRDAVQAGQAHGDAVARILGGDPREDLEGARPVAPLHRGDRVDVLALAP